jgi:hypothetical protein
MGAAAHREAKVLGQGEVYPVQGVDPMIWACAMGLLSFLIAGGLVHEGRQSVGFDMAWDYFWALVYIACGIFLVTIPLWGTP